MKQVIKQLMEQLGWQGMSGIFLLVLAGVFQTLVLKSLEQDSASMHNRLDAARAKASMATRTFSSVDSQKELSMFFNSLPAEQDVTNILASIYNVAEANGVEFRQAEYHLNDRDRPRVEYGIIFPVQGEYAKIRLFVSRILADNRAISLDQINFQRDRISEPILKAEIRLTLFLKPSK